MIMQLTGVLMALVMALFTMSCATSRSNDVRPIRSGWPVETSALSWLMKQQNGDGHWGEGGNSVALTSLATLAFLSRGETPASSTYGRCVENALCALLRDMDAQNKRMPETEAIHAWCLAAAYSMTLNPTILDSMRVQFERLDFCHATPWHVFAAKALATSGAWYSDLGNSALATMRSTLINQPDSLLNQATHVLLGMSNRDLKQTHIHLDAVRRLSPAKWREQETPLLSALMLSTVFLWTGGQEWKDWHKIFYPDVISRQSAENSLGWWPAETLLIDPLSLPAFARSDTSVYVTCMVLLTFPPERILPSTMHTEPLEKDLWDDEDEIKIEVGI